MKIRFHWQNLRKDERGFPWYGRAWLYLTLFAHEFCLAWSWNLWSHFCGVSVTVDQEDAALQFHVALPPVSLWLSFRGVFSRAWLHRHFRYEDRETSLRIHDWHLWWTVWRDDNGWDSSVPRWRSGNIDFLKLLLGKEKYSTRDLNTHRVTIPMPEGGYPAEVRFFESTWKRPRWFARRLVRADIKPLKPIPFPGKGENSWDCGEDALHGLTCPATTIEEAVARTVASVLRSRRRNGGDTMMAYPTPGVA